MVFAELYKSACVIYVRYENMMTAVGYNPE